MAGIYGSHIQLYDIFPFIFYVIYQIFVRKDYGNRYSREHLHKPRVR